MKKKVKVVGAIIENEKNEVLCALRSFDMALSNYWEFPGGKVEEGESLKTALEREITEELDCEVVANEKVYDSYTHEYEKVIVELITLKCRITRGIPFPKEHQSLLWLDKSHLGSLNWAPADIPTVDKLIAEAMLFKF